MPDEKQARPVKGRHQARKRAVDLLFEAEARGLTPVEVVDLRTALAEAKPEVAGEGGEVAAIHPLAVVPAAHRLPGPVGRRVPVG